MKTKEKKPPSKMGGPIRLPGVWGALARTMGGVGILADRLGTSERNLNFWARNQRGMDCLTASKLADLCSLYGVTPMLFEFPDKTHLACTPRDGWVSFPSCSQGWEDRARIVGLPDPKWEAASKYTTDCARKSGWPF